MSRTATALLSAASRQWGDWLEAMEWHVLLTVTFSPRKFTKISHEMALRRVRDGMNWLGGYMRRPIAWIAFTEFTTTNHVHVHVLTHFTDSHRPNRRQLQGWHKWWKRRNGIVRRDHYVPGLGGARYGAKRAGSSGTEWDCSNELVKMVRRDSREKQLSRREHPDVQGDTKNAARCPDSSRDRKLVEGADVQEQVRAR